ncbi:uncharacterized protein METZ01_LOCUS264138, partial [marine metagenome]
VIRQFYIALSDEYLYGIFIANNWLTNWNLK